MQEPEDKVVAKIKPGSGFGELGFLSAKGRTKGAKTGPAGAHVLYVNYELCEPIPSPPLPLTSDGGTPRLPHSPCRCSAAPAACCLPSHLTPHSVNAPILLLLPSPCTLSVGFSTPLSPHLLHFFLSIPLPNFQSIPSSPHVPLCLSTLHPLPSIPYHHATVT